MKKKGFTIVLIIAISALVLSGCKNAGESKYEETKIKMDTVMTITAYGPAPRML